jgi:radical SAM/Cys-rich protein
MAGLTLLRQGSALANAAQQLRILEQESGVLPFSQSIQAAGQPALRATGIQVFQLNLGKVCNQTCRHCHVDAGPERKENMSAETAELCLQVLAETDIPTVDVTGGAPEMNPNFKRIVQESRRLGRHIIDRCNLTILLAPGFTDLPNFLAENQVEIVASLPCYLEQNVDAQRGDGVFEKSIQALRLLNELGYGQPGSPRTLTLVFNPLGPSLPPSQAKLEEAYRHELQSRYGIVFTRLFTVTNMPISRFLDDLVQSGQYASYMQKLLTAFNPTAVSGVMCRTTLSVDWQGFLYDCDFNQMLDLRVEPAVPQHIRDFNLGQLASRRIVIGQHCYGCTAGAGSSCQGSIL